MPHNWVLLRGLTRGNGHWGEFPDLLKSTGAKVELAEIPGNGTRSQEKTPLDVLEVIQGIRERISFCKKKEKFHLLGISLGGMVALKWAEFFSDELESVAILNSSFAQFSPFYRRLRPQAYQSILTSLLNRDFIDRERKILALISNHSEVRDKYLNQFSDFSKQHPVLIENFLRQIVLSRLIKLSGRSNLPVKIIASEKDRLVDVSCSLEIAKFFNLQPIVHPIAGHDLPLDDPQWLVGVLIRS